MADNPQEPFSMAIEDYYSQPDSPIEVKLYVQNVAERQLDVSMFFEAPKDFLEIDKIAYGLCRGRTLDIGAGVGRFAIPLQEDGLSIYAVEESETAVAIMRQKGLENVFCGALDEFLQQSWPDKKFDTILMMMNGLGIVGTLDKLGSFFEQIKRFLKPDGQIIADSTDVHLDNLNDFSRHIAFQEQKFQYPGEIYFNFEYKGIISSPIPWLHVDEKTLTKVAKNNGWRSDVVYRGADGAYLTRLTMI